MGKKAKRKKLKLEGVTHKKPDIQASNGLALFLIEIIRWGAYIAFFAPLIVHPAFFFPFVVPKTVFFWIFAEIIAAAWILLAISNKQFRPKWNPISVAFGVFLLITIIASFTGVNTERSFWSTFERMAGTINWIHLALFFFVLSSTFRTFRDWRKLLTVSLIAAAIVSIIFLFQKIGISLIPFNTKSGSTIGNSSFMAAYLLFNVFLGAWLFVSSFKNYLANRTGNIWLPLFYGVGLGLLVLTVLLSTAYGALFSMFGGFFIIFLAWLFFSNKSKIMRVLAVLLLALSIFLGSVVAWGTFTQNEAIIGKLPYFFSKSISQSKGGAIGARKVVWDMAWQGVKERPILGWGPENFNVVFTKYFNPCMTLSECGGEVWFDRTHNIFLDNLIHSGILGLLSYLSLFVAALFLVWKNFWRNKDDLVPSQSRDWLLPSVITAALTSYFAQNLLVFDMLNTYLMFVFTLAFVAGIGGEFREKTFTPDSIRQKELNPPNPFLVIVVSFLLLYYLFSFGIQSLQAANWGIKIGRGGMDAQETIDLYKKSLSVSPMGNRQIVEFFTSKVIGVAAAGSKLPKEFIVEVRDIMVKTIEENPLDFRHYILLGSFYNATKDYDPTYLDKAEEILERAIDLSPTNQQGYTSLGQTYVFKDEFEKAIEVLKKARDLEPRYGRAHFSLGEAYRLAGEDELAEESFKRAEELGYKPRK